MPYVNVQITKGASRQQKAEIVKDITDSLVRVLGKKPEHTHVVIQEIADEDWGYSGMLTDDWKATQAKKPITALARVVTFGIYYIDVWNG